MTNLKQLVSQLYDVRKTYKGNDAIVHRVSGAIVLALNGRLPEAAQKLKQVEQIKKDGGVYIRDHHSPIIPA